MGDVRSRAGAPTTNDFNSPLGMPIVVNQTTGDAYVMLSDSTVSGLNTTGNAATATTAIAVSTTVASGATGTTQSVGDNSTKIATTAFVQNALPSRKNLIINGAFDIAQRGTTYALTTTFAYGCVDRWGFHQATTAACTASQVAIATSGIPFRYGLKLQRTAAATTTGVISATTAFETTDSVKFAGKQVTLSFYAKAGANYSAASSILNFAVITGTGTDQANASDPSSTWTGAATPLSVAQAVTTTWTRYSVTGTLATSATQIAVRAYWTPVGTAGADDSVQITGIQLEVGASATDFEFRGFAQELALCQRYFQTVGSNFSGNTITNNYEVNIPFWCELRIAPTISVKSDHYFNGRYCNSAGAVGDVSQLNPTLANTTVDKYGIWTQVSIGGTTGGYMINGRHQQGVLGDFISADAEL